MYCDRKRKTLTRLGPCFLTGCRLWGFCASSNKRKTSEDRRTARAVSDNDSQQAPHGAAITPISAENDSREPQTAEIQRVEVEHATCGSHSLSLFGRERNYWSYGKEGQRIQLRYVWLYFATMRINRLSDCWWYIWCWRQAWLYFIWFQSACFSS